MGSDLTFDPPFKVKFVLATFNLFFYFHFYSEAQNTKSADTEPVHWHRLLVYFNIQY